MARACPGHRYKAMRPILRLTSNIVNYAHLGVVHSVIVDGDFVMRDRKVLTIDEPALLAEAQEVTERVWRRMVAANADIARQGAKCRGSIAERSGAGSCLRPPGRWHMICS